MQQLLAKVCKLNEAIDSEVRFMSVRERVFPLRLKVILKLFPLNWFSANRITFEARHF